MRKERSSIGRLAVLPQLAKPNPAWRYMADDPGRLACARASLIRESCDNGSAPSEPCAAMIQRGPRWLLYYFFLLQLVMLIIQIHSNCL